MQQDIIKRAALVRPSERQMAWQETEFYAFIHFSVNTFTDREWGLGDESPSVFNPTALDAGQWADVCLSAGMKGLILTCKHHDGFCLWPSRYTLHSVKSSPWRNGTGDVVREASDACRRAGLKFGIYLSPWDRHEKSYGDSERYNEYFKNQLRELLTGYGDIFSVWLDGACGEGPDGRRPVYDWNGWYDLIRELQPGAAISVCGPDARWCGNEAGHCRESEWSVVPKALQDAEKTAEKSQKQDDGKFSRQFRTDDSDLGSREAIRNAGELAWYPAEVNTSIRPGWFYHAREDGMVRTPGELVKIYHASVGGNANFLLNIPPDKRGLIHEKDAENLLEMGRIIHRTFAVNLAENGTATASESMDEEHGAGNMLDGRKDTFWRPMEGTEKAKVEVDLGSARTFDTIVLMEHIRSSGQRIESFMLEAEDGEGWKQIFKGTVVGYKRICGFAEVTARRVRLTIEQSRWYPALSGFFVFHSINNPI